MSNTVQMSEASVDSLIPTWTGLELWHATTQGGTYSLLVQIPYVAHQVVYTYVDTAGLSTDWYEVRRYGPGPTYGPYSPAWSVSVIQPARRSFANCRRILARRLQGYELPTTSSAGAADGSSLVALSLANVIDPDRYRSWWALISDPNAPAALLGQVRKVGNQALAVASGTLSFPTVKWPAQVPSGVQIELHKYLPPLDNQHGSTGLRECLNAALRELWVPDRLLLAGSSTTAVYDLTSFGPWLEPAAVHELWYPPSGNTMVRFQWPGFSAWRAGSALNLDAIGLPTGQNMEVEVTRQGDTLIRSGGVWTDNSSGFVNDTDESLFQPEFLVEIALAHAYAALADTSSGTDHGEWAAKADDQRRYSAFQKLKMLTHVEERLSHPVTGLGFGADWPMLIR
ncbi:MAG: hypothetical protein E6J20_20005 [Chloroflexi bacterium]|nr:MAG: hypothetical protein E6J20_20005 [Chloroflexota bacterium]